MFHHPPNKNKSNIHVQVKRTACMIQMFEKNRNETVLCYYLNFFCTMLVVAYV